MPDRPPPDPVKLLEDWMEWERGDETPGRVMANLKTHGLRAPRFRGDGNAVADVTVTAQNR